MSTVQVYIDGTLVYNNGANPPSPIPPDPVPPNPIPPQPIPVPPDGGSLAPPVYLDWNGGSWPIDIPSTPGMTTPVVLTVPVQTPPIYGIEILFAYTSAGSDGKMDLTLYAPNGTIADGPKEGVNHVSGNLRAGPDYGTVVYPGQWVAHVKALDFSTPVRINHHHQP